MFHMVSEEMIFIGIFWPYLGAFLLVGRYFVFDRLLFSLNKEFIRYCEKNSIWGKNRFFFVFFFFFVCFFFFFFCFVFWGGGCFVFLFVFLFFVVVVFLISVFHRIFLFWRCWCQ